MQTSNLINLCSQLQPIGNELVLLEFWQKYPEIKLIKMNLDEKTEKTTSSPSNCLSELDRQQVATILAALRHWQSLEQSQRSAYPQFSVDGTEPLNNEAIDQLCEQINFTWQQFVPFVLDDFGDREDQVKGKVALSSSGIELLVDGYGTHSMEPGYGSQVYIEYYEKELMVLVWADINQEDPTHTISLQGALESHRK